MSRSRGNKVTPEGISLASHTRGGATATDYFQGIPTYTGDTIPQTLKRNKTFNPYARDYYNFVTFLHSLAEFKRDDDDSKWIVAGLLAETPPPNLISVAKKHSKSGDVNKQILCKRISPTKIVFIINVVNSNKTIRDDSVGLSVRLNDKYVKKIMVLDDRNNVLVYSLDEEETPNLKTVTNTDDIEGILSQTTVYVVDPNKVKNEQTRVIGFEGKSIAEINTIIEQIIPPMLSPSASPSPSGGKRRTNNYATRRKIKTRVCKPKRSRRRRTSRK